MAAAIAALAWDRTLSREAASARAELSRAEAELRELATRPRESGPTQALPPLLPASRLDEVLKECTAFAGARNVRLQAVRVEHAAIAADVARAALAVQLSGDYAGVKSWLSDVLARFPSLAVQSLAMRAADNRQLDVSVSLAIYVAPQR